MENLAQNLIDTLRESLLVLDFKLKVQIANPSFYRAFQLREKDVIGRPIFEIGDGEWDIARLREALQDIVENGTQFEGFDIEHDFANIGFKAMLLNARPVQREAGETPLILLAMDDVTPQYLARAALQQHLRKLEWSNRELEDFAYIASHDLQEPLRAIQAFSERVQTKHGDRLDAQGNDYLARIQKAAGRMSLLISDLLKYSRVTTQGKPFENVSLTKIMRECLADLASRIEETGGKVEWSSLPVVEGDPTQLRQLFQNLLDNALKFHHPTRSPVVKVSWLNSDAESEAAPAHSEAEKWNKFVRAERCCIELKDNGIGFDEKYAERIFSPFERLHNQNKYPGTGIGLAVCRRIVERHNGTIKVHSVEGEGTTISLELPRKQLEASLPVPEVRI